jgi:hypothetical protein
MEKDNYVHLIGYIKILIQMTDWHFCYIQLNKYKTCGSQVHFKKLWL